MNFIYFSTSLPVPLAPFYYSAPRNLTVIEGDTVTVDSSNFDTTNYDSRFSSPPPPEGITWLFQPFGGSCITLTPDAGGSGFGENTISFSADRQSLTIQDIRGFFRGGELFRVVMVNGSIFVQTLAVQSKNFSLARVL